MLDIDERYAPFAVHFAECIRYVTKPLSYAIRITRATKLKATIRSQRTSSKHGYVVRKSYASTAEDGQGSFPRT